MEAKSSDTKPAQRVTPRTVTFTLRNIDGFLPQGYIKPLRAFLHNKLSVQHTWLLIVENHFFITYRHSTYTRVAMYKNKNGSMNIDSLIFVIVY